MKIDPAGAQPRAGDGGKPGDVAFGQQLARRVPMLFQRRFRQSDTAA
jgi:hypothetical protein